MTGELQSLLASARALVAELVEEGVDRLEPTGPLVRSAPAARSSPAPAQPAKPTLEEVRAVLGDCRRCRLCDGRTQIVFGDGNPNARLLFVGEGPGEQEDLRGIPFCGRAGELLTSMIEKGLGIPRSDVYICNIVKCRPPDNRTPLPDEVASCRPFLDGQIEAIAPRVIVALGSPRPACCSGATSRSRRSAARGTSIAGSPSCRRSTPRSCCGSTRPRTAASSGKI